MLHARILVAMGVVGVVAVLIFVGAVGVIASCTAAWLLGFNRVVVGTGNARVIRHSQQAQPSPSSQSAPLSAS